MSYLPARAAHNPDDRLRDLERMAAHDPAAAARLRHEQARRAPQEKCQMTRRGGPGEPQWVDVCDYPVAGRDPFSGDPLCDFHLAPIQREWAARGRRDLWFGRVRAGDRMRPPRMNPGDDRLRALERAALLGDPAAAAALEQERRRRGLPVDERRRYIADLTYDVADEVLGSRRGEVTTPVIAKAVRAVLKAEKVKNMSVRSVGVLVLVNRSHTAWMTGEEWATLQRLFFGNVVALDLDLIMRQGTGRDVLLYVHNRNMPDLAHGRPEGPSLPWWSADVYRQALRRAIAQIKPSRRRPRARQIGPCDACGDVSQSLHIVSRGGQRAYVCGECYERFTGMPRIRP